MPPSIQERPAATWNVASIDQRDVAPTVAKRQTARSTSTALAASPSLAQLTARSRSGSHASQDNYVLTDLSGSMRAVLFSWVEAPNPKVDLAAAAAARRAEEQRAAADAAAKAAADAAARQAEEERAAAAADAAAQAAAAASARTTPHIQEMNGRSGQVKNRWMPTIDFHSKKPASPQYHYAKSLSAAARTEVAAHLERIIKAGGDEGLGVSLDQAVQMWLSIQHARLRTHKAEQRADHRRAHIGKMLLRTGNPVTAVKDLRQEHKNYYRDRLRPEYEAAFNAFMTALADPDMPDGVKTKLAAELVDRHLGTEKTIAPDDGDRIVEALDGPPRRASHTTRRLPANRTPEMYQAAVDMAAGGYRSTLGAVTVTTEFTLSYESSPGAKRVPHRDVF